MKCILLLLALTLVYSCSTNVKPEKIMLSKTDVISKNSSDLLSLGQIKYLNHELSFLCKSNQEEEAKQKILSVRKKMRKKALFWNQVAVCYQNLKQYDKSLFYYDYAFGFAKTKHEKDILLNNKAILYIEMGNTVKGYLIFENLKGSNENLVHVNRALLSNKVGHTKKYDSMMRSLKNKISQDQNFSKISNIAD